MHGQAPREKINHKTEGLFDQRLARAMEMVRASGARSNPRDGLAGGIAQTKMVRLEGLEPPRLPNGT